MSGGDFASSTVACLANDITTLHEYPPDEVEPVWILVRAILGTGNLSYNVLSADQSADRDAGIRASGNDCP
jgi:hypothetical protein